MQIKRKALKKLLKITAPPRGQGKNSKKFFKKNGFYHEDCWNLDITMAWFILPRLLYFRKKVNSWPNTCNSLEEWREKLDTMIEAFHLILTDSYMWDTEEIEKIQKGLEVFAENYLGLWS